MLAAKLDVAVDHVIDGLPVIPRDFSHRIAGDSHDDGVVGDDRAGRQDGPRGNDASTSDFTFVQQNATDPHKRL